MSQITPHRLSNSRGFTLIETMVALGIFVIVTTIVFVGNGRFNNTLLLTNLAYDLALTVSRAQSYGINVRPFDDATKPFEVGYGVHFKLGTTVDPKESDKVSFVLFADINNSKNYTTDEFLERYLIRHGNKISKLWFTSDGNSINELNITFLRPNPDAIFNCVGCSGASKVGIEVSSADGVTTKVITIESTGQISVQSKI